METLRSPTPLRGARTIVANVPAMQESKTITATHAAAAMQLSASSPEGSPVHAPRATPAQLAPAAAVAPSFKLPPSALEVLKAAEAKNKASYSDESYSAHYHQRARPSQDKPYRLTRRLRSHSPM